MKHGSRVDEWTKEWMKGIFYFSHVKVKQKKKRKKESMKREDRASRGIKHNANTTSNCPNPHLRSPSPCSWPDLHTEFPACVFLCTVFCSRSCRTRGRVFSGAMLWRMRSLEHCS